MSLATAAPDVIAAAITQRVDAIVQRHASQARQLTIADAAIDITVEDAIAERMLTPFAHVIATNAKPPELSIFVAALRDDEFDLERLPDTGVVFTTGSIVVHLHRESAIAFDRAARRIHALIRNEGSIASWHRAKPLQVPLSIFFAERGIDFVHGGLVSLDGDGLLIAGMGGSGKSTTSVAALLDGFDFLGDDCVAVHGTTGFSIFASSCLERSHLARFPLGREIDATDDGDAKDVLPLSRWFGDQLAASTRIRAIVLPRVTHADAITFQRVAARDALLALAPSSILKRAVPAGETLARIATLARRVPAFRFEMGPVDAIGAQLRALLAAAMKESA